MTTVQLYQNTLPVPPMLLRRTDDGSTIVDEAWLDGRWQPTKIILDYVFGNNDFVEPIDRPRAVAIAPGALS